MGRVVACRLIRAGWSIRRKRIQHVWSRRQRRSVGVCSVLSVMVRFAVFVGVLGIVVIPSTSNNVSQLGSAL